MSISTTEFARLSSDFLRQGYIEELKRRVKVRLAAEILSTKPGAREEREQAYILSTALDRLIREIQSAVGDVKP